MGYHDLYYVRRWGFGNDKFLSINLATTQHIQFSKNISTATCIVVQPQVYITKYCHFLLQAPQLQAGNAYFTNQSCLSKITLLFNTNTSTPVVEIQPDLGFLLHLDPPELNKALRRGHWFDYRTLVLVFDKCVEWERMTTNGRERPMFVVFEAQRGVLCVCVCVCVCV